MKTLHNMFSSAQSVAAEQAFIIVTITAMIANIAWLMDWMSGLSAIGTIIAITMVMSLITAESVRAAGFRLLVWLFFSTVTILSISFYTFPFGITSGWVPTGAAVVLAATSYLMFRFVEPYR